MELRKTRLDKLELSLGRLRQLAEGAVAAMVQSLEKKGQLSPLVAAEREDGILVLVDGFIRRLAAQRLGWQSMQVEVVRLSPVQMKAQLYIRNRERGLRLVEECRLVLELVEVDGQSQVEVGDLLERHKSWVCRRLSLIRQLSPHLLAEADVGLLSTGSLRKLAQVQPSNQEELWAAARREELPQADTSLLVDLWRRAPDPEARQYVLDHPLSAVQVARGRAETPTDARLGARGEEVRTSLEIMRRSGLRLVRRLRDGMGEIPPEGVRLLAEVHRKAQVDCMQALGELSGWLSNEGGRP